GHSNICYIACTFWQNTLISSLHMCMCSNHCTYTPINIHSHCLFFTCCFSMKIEKNDICSLSCFLDDFISFTEGIVQWVEKTAALYINNCHFRSVYINKNAPLTRSILWKISWANHVLCIFYKLKDFFFCPCMISQCHYLGTMFKKFFIYFFCNTFSCSGILSINNGNVWTVLFL